MRAAQDAQQPGPPAADNLCHFPTRVKRTSSAASPRLPSSISTGAAARACAMYGWRSSGGSSAFSSSPTSATQAATSPPRSNTTDTVGVAPPAIWVMQAVLRLHKGEGRPVKMFQWMTADMACRMAGEVAPQPCRPSRRLMLLSRWEARQPLARQHMPGLEMSFCLTPGPASAAAAPSPPGRLPLLTPATAAGGCCPRRLPSAAAAPGPRPRCEPRRLRKHGSQGVC